MGELDFGLTPNVWRPSLVPYPSTGSDEGFHGASTTVTQEEFHYANQNPPTVAKGWQLIQNPFSSAKVTSVIATTNSGTAVTALTDVIPIGASHWMAAIYGTVRSTNAALACQSTITIHDAVTDVALSTANVIGGPAPTVLVNFIMFFRAAIQGTFSAAPNDTVTYVDSNGTTKSQIRSIRWYIQDAAGYVGTMNNPGRQFTVSTTSGGSSIRVNDFSTPAIFDTAFPGMLNRGVLADGNGFAVNIKHFTNAAAITSELIDVYTYYM